METNPAHVTLHLKLQTIKLKILFNKMLPLYDHTFLFHWFSNKNFCLDRFFFLFTLGS